MQVTHTTLPEVLLLKPKQYSDERGLFMETYNEKVMRELGLPTEWRQDNFSLSKRHVVRGLHYQVTQPQGKLVRVLYGTVLDIAVDLRRSSPDFGKHVAVPLSAEDGATLYIPEGFGHGFAVLTAEAGFSYKVTDYYSAAGERTILWDDPELGIDWSVNAHEAIISAKDAAGTRFADAEVFA